MRSSLALTLKLRIQNHVCKFKFIEIDMIPCFDIVSGDDWSKEQAVVAYYGATSKCHGPYLLLGKTQTILELQQADCAKSDTSCGISAHGAAKLLATPRFGSASPFVVLTRKVEQPGEGTDPHASSRLAKLLGNYGDVFATPRLSKTGASTLGDLTPEFIPIIPGSTPFNRSPFRLSVKEKAEIEQQVQ